MKRIIVIVGLGLVLCGCGLASPEPSPRIEVISRDRGWAIDERPSVTVVVDEGLLSFDKTRDLAVLLFGSGPYRRITICDPAKFVPTEKLQFEHLYCFGNTSDILGDTKHRPIALYVVMPTLPPSTGDAQVVTGVILSPKVASTSGTVNDAWRGWCRKNAMPWDEAKLDYASLSKALDRVSDKVEELREKITRSHRRGCSFDATKTAGVGERLAGPRAAPTKFDSMPAFRTNASRSSGAAATPDCRVVARAGDSDPRGKGGGGYPGNPSNAW